jgi:hypothetical protein
MLFLLIAVTNGGSPMLPTDVRQLKPSLLLDKTTKKVSRLNEFAGSEPFFVSFDFFDYSPNPIKVFARFESE